MRKFLYSLFFVSFCHAATPVPVECPVVVIGSGVAGLTAATYLGRAGLTPCVIDGGLIGGAITQSKGVQNWPGELEIAGTVLVDKLKVQAEHSGAVLSSGKVTAVDFSKRPFKITVQPLMGGEVKELLAEAVLIAMGSNPNLLHVPGESQYWLKGVYSCAVCDGGLYKDKVVAVVGGGDAALEEAQYLSSLAKKVYLIVRGSQFKGKEIKRIESVLHNPKITVFYQTTIQEVQGDGEKVTSLSLLHTDSQKKEFLPVDALFLKIGATPNTALFKDQLELTDQGYIQLVHHQETSIPGVFAAGDIADPEFQQAICASGDGAKAALQIQRFLSLQQTKSPAVASAPVVEHEVLLEIGSKKELEEVMAHSGDSVLFIDFYSTRCPPCKAFAPYYEAWARHFQGKITFIKVNADTGRELFDLYRIQAVPTLMILDKKGQVLAKKVGIPEIAEIDEKLKTCQADSMIDAALFNR